jgi:hypothetical protein
MAKFLLLYHGGKTLPSPEKTHVPDIILEKRIHFPNRKKLSDIGIPVMPGIVVSSEGAVPGSIEGEISEYAIISAQDMETAISIVKDIPGIRNGLKIAVFPLNDIKPNQAK